LPQAIQCYRAQTYLDRELLIVADGEDVSNLIPDDASIRLIHLERRLKTGDKRNFGCAQAFGSVIAHWDDDDYSAPGRLDDQICRLVESGKPITGYRTMRFTDGKDWWLHNNGLSYYAFGTSLCYRKDWWRTHPFKSVQEGEDTRFVMEHPKEIAAVEAGDLMIATIHPDNTSPRKLIGSSSWKQCDPLPMSSGRAMDGFMAALTPLMDIQRCQLTAK